MNNQETTNNSNVTGTNKRTPKKIDQADINKMSEGSDDEISFDSQDIGEDIEVNPSRDDKEIDLERRVNTSRTKSGEGVNRGISSPKSGSGQQSFKQQEQQQTGTPSSSSQNGDAVARRAGMNSGTQGIGTGSAQGYEGNTDDSGLDNDEGVSAVAGDEMNIDYEDDDNDAVIDLSGAGGSDIDDVGDESRTSGQARGSNLGSRQNMSRVSDQKVKQQQDDSRRQ